MYKKKIGVLTASRAEYGLLRPLINALTSYDDFEVLVYVTGMHLSAEFGWTYHEIENDGYEIAIKIPILLNSDTPASISKSMGLAMIGFADYFEENTPDLLVVLGDRFETQAVCCTALNARIPIAHLYGGETTEGAVDEAYRHSITKMSYLHFTSTEDYRTRVVQLGENPERVFNVGSLGVENVKHISLLSKDETEKSIGFILDKPYALITFHPVTLEPNTAEMQFRELLYAIDSCSNMKFIFTKANCDTGGRIINKMIDEYTHDHNNAILFDSLGVIRYLSCMKYAAIVIGNSSSGLIEAPSFGVPTVNIGNRQQGRIRGQSIIDCDPESNCIKIAINEALTDGYKNKARMAKNPYGDGNASKAISEILHKALKSDIKIKKKFYDITHAGEK